MSRFNKEIEIASGTITKLEIQKKRKDRVNVFLEEAYAFSCHVDLVFEYKLDKGVWMDLSAIRRVVEADDEKMAYLYGLKMTLMKSVSIAQVKRKLATYEFNEQAIESAIYRLIENDCLDDEKHARNYYEMKQHVYGRNRILQELLRHGVQRQTVQKVIEEQADEEVEFEEALSLGRKKLQASGVLDQKTYTRIYGFLMRKGYSVSVLRRVMDQLRSSDAKTIFEMDM